MQPIQKVGSSSIYARLERRLELETPNRRMSVDKTRAKGRAQENAGGTQTDQVSHTLPSEKPHSSSLACSGPDRQESRRSASCLSEKEQLKPSVNHTVCIDAAAVQEGRAIPFVTPNTEEIWRQDCVKMPFSNFSLQTKMKSGLCRHEVKVRRWEVIKAALDNTKFETSKDLENAIKQYNQKYAHLWTFTGLYKHLDQLPGAERQYLLRQLLPEMAKLALRLPDLCSKPIPLLKRGKSQAITMSQEQIACLLANAFFCTFPHRNSTQLNSEYITFPDINFSRLFARSSQRTTEKLKTIFCYFSMVTENMPTGLVTFQRCCLHEAVKWKRSQCKLTQLQVCQEGRIEEEGCDLLQVDFAAPMVGGGVLSSGLVQEEIRFLINPELIAARLFTEKLEDNECLLVTGAQRYSDYGGYSDSYRWLRYHNDETPRDPWLRRHTQIVAIDAINFQNPADQYKPHYLERELNKAYCGFSCHVIPAWRHSAVATGNWGCGAYKGDAKLKALIQIMAAAQAQRDVLYFTFGDSTLTRSLSEMHQLLQRMDVRVGQLYNLLEKYSRHDSGIRKGRDLYEFIQSSLNCLKGRI
ncbi:poly(ADP-ribose) glycohydrolase-like isoform X2 [Heterodontus francisci]|uniref:poly(ADP-ribose) glycohydrolase-like isoform X2 n=1 Tax=Heterodontus francisci TaxID=7792 RepID=UPI00355B6E13